MHVLEGMRVLHLAGVEADHANLVVGRRHDFGLHHAFGHLERDAQARRPFSFVIVVIVVVASSSSTTFGFGWVAHHEGLNIDEEDDVVTHVLKGLARC
jgi:hypothetical protein